MDQNPLEMLMQLLMGQAQSRPDLGSPQPVATMAGRVVGPGDTMQSALSRMPMGSGEGDPLTATLQAAMGPMAQGASSAMVAKLLPLLAGGAGGGFRLQGAQGAPRPTGPINPSVGGNTLPPPDPWGVQRQPATRGPAPSMATNVQSPNAGLIELPRNPRDVPWTQQQQGEYNKLPQAGRSQASPEDMRRRGMGEQGAGPQMEQPTRSTSATDTYAMFKQLAQALGIQIQ